MLETFTISITYVSVEILDQGGKSRIIQGEFSSSSDERDWEIVNREDQGKIYLCTVEDPFYKYSLVVPISITINRSNSSARMLGCVAGDPGSIQDEACLFRGALVEDGDVRTKDCPHRSTWEWYH